jgi:hypothetical protein
VFKDLLDSKGAIVLGFPKHSYLAGRKKKRGKQGTFVAASTFKRK